jgi:hypothetical protein
VQNDPSLHLVDTVSITFEQQKHDTKHGIITHHDKILCPVKIWSKIAHRLILYPTSNPDTIVNTYYYNDGTKLLFIGPHLLKRLRLADATISDFTPNQIGLHSARSGTAMAMYLAGFPVFTIMLLGRWCSDAFL